jgi:hypothetical protein
MKPLAFLTILTVSCLPMGCGRSSSDKAEAQVRNRVLLQMAAEEAGGVESPKLRLKQQLNIAEIQIRNGHDHEAQASLAQAWRTLETTQTDLDTHTMLAGWVSISELSRRADDKKTAARAARTAEDALLALEDPTERCDYVLDLARELALVFDEQRATKLLVTAGPWAAMLKPQSRRREVYVAFADRLFDYEAYRQGRALLARDPEPYWRSETLIKLAQGPLDKQTMWKGKWLDYESNF